ncbi:hypothetical protein LTR39_006972, partial [Cryomyces antarcticus]
PLDPVSARLRYPQVLHFHSGSAYSSGDTQSRESAEGLGLGHWKEEAEGQEQYGQG